MWVSRGGYFGLVSGCFVVNVVLTVPLDHYGGY